MQENIQKSEKRYAVDSCLI